MTLFIVATDKYDPDKPENVIGVVADSRQLRSLIAEHMKDNDSEGRPDDYWVLPTTVGAYISTEQQHWLTLKEYYELYP